MKHLLRGAVSLVVLALVVPVVLAGAPVQIIVGAAADPKVDPMPELIAAARQVTGVDPVRSNASDIAATGAAPPGPALFVVGGLSVEQLEQHGFLPLLVAERGGKTGAVYVLMGRDGTKLEGLVNGRLAVRDIPAGLMTVLQRSLLEPAGIPAGALRPVQVSKSIDALLAVKNSQVELALVDAAELEQTRRLAPAVATGLTELKRSPELPIAVIAVRKAADAPELRELAAQLQKRTGPAQGGIERWVPVAGRAP